MARSRYSPGRGRSRYGRSARRRGAASILYGLGIAGLIILLGAVAWYVRGIRHADAIDEATLCPADGAVAATAVLLDLTDPLTATQSLALRSFLEDRIAASPRGTLVSVGRVSDDPESQGAVLATCKPMTGAEAGEWVRNPAMVEATYQERFLEPFRRELAAMLDAAPASQSPIMEGLQALLVGAAPIDVVPGAPREIVLVSDLLQHSGTMSFYRGETWSDFRTSEAYGRLARNLDGQEVTLLRLPRSAPGIDPADVDDFWVRYFEAQGAQAIHPRVLGDL